ncbi:MAG: cation-translocating P-type ATPase [Planctomycetaceae bacterium]|nr:cation-translocating P-type ATPase [Planctomycetaceae bacterium]
MQSPVEHAPINLIDAPHAQTLDSLAKLLRIDPGRGLTTEQACQRLQSGGYNELREAPRDPTWKRFLGQFSDPIVWILIVAAIVAGVVGEWVDTIAILAIVLLNAIISFLQEERAEHAITALQKMSSPTAKVRRDGSLVSLPARELVPGDRIELEAGDHIPADARLLDAYFLRVEEAPLTGESTPTDKQPVDNLATDVPLGDRTNMAYLGTVCVAGKASAVVVATGMNSELGKIAGLLSRSEREPTPLQRRLAELGKILGIVCLVIVAIIFLFQIQRGSLFEVFLSSISLAVAAVPEGLPAVVTLALALGLQRVAKRNALVRKLPSVETLGSVTVICSDKTGTLTRNEMTVREIVTGSKHYHLSGIGYAPHGEFRLDKASEPVSPADNPDLIQALTIASRCNSAAVHPREDSDDWQVVGDPTEGALIVAALKAGIPPDPNSHELVHEIPFDSDRKAMSVVLQQPDGRILMFTKGAPEVILRDSTSELLDGNVVQLSDERRHHIRTTNSQMASRALRVLGVAYRELPSLDDRHNERDLIFAGLIGMIDPPREEVKEAIARCRTAGIRPVMITGDHPETAQAIASELGIVESSDRVLPGQELDTLSDDRLLETVDYVSAYARVSAEHKLRIVSALKNRGHVVAMTGDGVNDAPAVKTADIGIAMGITGTDVTKQAADMILTDDNFTSIVNAVEEGRAIFDNIRKVVYFLLSCNAGEILLMFFAAVIGWPVPLAAIQILWINLVTDSLPALALTLEAPEQGVMRRPPRSQQEPVIPWNQGVQIVLYGILVATACILGFWFTYRGDPAQLDVARATTFCIASLSQLAISFAFRSPYRTLPQLGLFTNPWLVIGIIASALLQVAVVLIPAFQHLFEIEHTLGTEWLIIALLSLAPVTVVELGKIVRFTRSRSV